VAGLYLLGAQIIGDGLMTVAVINDVSLRQALVPDGYLGRVSATANVLGVLAMPVGAVAGGFVGQLASPRAALAAGSLCFCLAALWIAMVPVRSPDPNAFTKEPEIKIPTDNFVEPPIPRNDNEF